LYEKIHEKTTIYVAFREPCRHVASPKVKSWNGGFEERKI
jgi:hypothetical protein